MSLKSMLVLAVVAALTACGGGGAGGNGTNGNPSSPPVGAISDSDNTANSVTENAAIGTAVGITLTATDPDSSDSVSYSLAQDAGGLFAVDASSGVVSVAGQLDFEQDSSHVVRGRARSSDGSQSEANFTIDIIDDVQELTLRTSFPVTNPSTVVHFSGSDIDISGTVSGRPGEALTVDVEVGGLSVPAAIDIDGNWRAADVLLGPDGVGSVSINVAAESQSGETASTQISISTETMFASPQSIAIDPGRRRALVVDTTTSELVAIDLVTGQRDVLSGPLRGSGPRLGLPGRVAVNSATNIAYVWRGPSFLAVDLATGNRTILSNSTTGTGPIPQGGFGDVFLDSVTNRLFVTGLNELIAIDLATGNRTLISGNGVGSGPDFGTPGGVVVLSDNRALVTDFGTSLLSVNLSNGNRTVVSSNSSGTGPDFEGRMNLTADEQNNRVLVVGNELSVDLMAVDLSTGNRTQISGNSAATPRILYPYGVVLDAPSNRVLVVDEIGKRVTAINLSSGARSVLSDNSVGSGDTPFQVSKLNPAFDRDRILVGHRNEPYLYSMDLQTGHRSILFDGSVGTGPDFSSFGTSIFDPANDRMVGHTGSGLIGLDLVTGDRTLLSDRDTVNGPSMNAIVDIALDSLANRILAVERDDRFNPTLLEIDLATGLRATLSGPSVGNGPNLDLPTGVILDQSRNRVIVADRTAAGLIAIDLSSADRSFIFASEQVDFFSTSSVALDDVSRRIFALGQNVDGQALEEIDESTGSRTLISSAVKGSGVPFDSTADLALDLANNRAFVVHNNGTEILIVDFVSGDRVTFAR